MPVNKLKLGRNDPCTCGSGKKHKKCCGSPTSQKITPARVPAEVIEKARQHFMEHQSNEQERIRQFGLIRPEIAADYQGYKFVAIGNKLLYKPADKCRFFTDVLIDHMPQLFGRDWFEQEIAKPSDERHPVMQWRIKGMNFMKKNDGSTGVIPSGPLFAYLTFAYDLYVVEHNAKLDSRLLERLKISSQFQGARHELFAEATCLRAGFEIVHEDETDPSRRHAEFTATHKATGQKLSVEAKSKHRPDVLGRAGLRESSNALNLRFGKLLNNAIAKKPQHPLAVFLDINVPLDAATRLIDPTQPPHRLILRTLDKVRKEHGGQDPISLLVLSNHPQHYMNDEELVQRQQHLLTIFSQVPVKSARLDVLRAVALAANLYGNIPQELPNSGT
jgi:hypothetical protein